MRASPSDYYLPTGFGGDYYDQGRTVTHELGHFFEIWHTWGNDGGLCPWNGGHDDGIADTPPEANYKYFAPAFTIAGGTFVDSCHTDDSGHNVQPIGVASLDFMNYTDDVAMQLFTPDQAAVMAAQVADSGENHSLTQNPALFDWGPVNTVSLVIAEQTLITSPNPTTGIINISFDQTTDQLLQVSIINILGQEVVNYKNLVQKPYYSFDIHEMNKGIYFVRCNFASGTVTRKILLQ